MTTTSRPRIIKVFTVLLVICATVSMTRGLLVAIGKTGSWDLTVRSVEYRYFAQHVYPDIAIEANSVSDEILYSVYPPYAFPMFAPYFASGSFLAAQIIFWATSFAALVAIGMYSFRELRAAGVEAAQLGAFAGIAIAHNSSAIAFGQFSIICMGWVAIQLYCLQRGKIMAAGLFWALAMLKPQIGLAFALPFLLDRRWRGLALGVAILGGLSWFTCIYTEVSPLVLIDHWFVRQSYSFITGGGSQGSSSGGILAAWGADSRTAMFISLAVAAAIGTFAWLRVRRSHMSMPVLIAVSAIAGRVFLPHRAYDNIMLFPALIALLALALNRKSVSTYAMAAAFGISVWVPFTSMVRFAWVDAALLMFWLAAAGFLVLMDAPRSLHLSDNR